MIKKTILISLKSNKRIIVILVLFVVSLLTISLATPQKNLKEDMQVYTKVDNNDVTDNMDRENWFRMSDRGGEPEDRLRVSDNDIISVEPLKGSVVVIDPGHGGNDSGASHEDFEEEFVNLDVSLKLGKLLSEKGINVIYTRDKDTYVGLNKRAAIANVANANLFISVHCNSIEDDDSCNGTETLYKNKKSDTGKLDSKRFAEIVQEELVSAMGTKNNGIVHRPRLAVLVSTRMPAVIAELAYISNCDDREKLTSEEFREKAAEALYKSVIKALDEMK